MEMDEKNSPKVLICSPQEQSIQTNYINIEKTGELPICRMSATRNKTISHIVSKCRKLAQKVYKRRHNSVGKHVHWHFSKKLGLNRARFWYEHEPENVVENKNFKILWGFIIQCGRMIEARRQDIVVVDKVKKETIIIHLAMPGDTRVCNKQREKIEKCISLKDKTARLWQMK